MGEIARTTDELRNLQQPVLEHMLDGIGHMKTFTGYLIEKPTSGRSELVLINKVLTPQIDKACSAFSNMKDHAERLLDIVNKILEKTMVDHKKVTDDLKNLEIRQKKLGIEIKGKLDEIHKAEENLNRKKTYLSNAKETLRNQESELKSRKKSTEGSCYRWYTNKRFCNTPCACSWCRAIFGRRSPCCWDRNTNCECYCIRGCH